MSYAGQLDPLILEVNETDTATGVTGRRTAAMMQPTMRFEIKPLAESIGVG